MTDKKITFREWLKENLSAILGFRIDDDLANVIINLETDAEVENYLKNLLDCEDCESKKFIANVMKNKNTMNMDSHFRQKNNEKYQNNPLKIRPAKEKDIKFNPPLKKETEQPEKSSEISAGKKKNKFVNFFAKDGETVFLKGRYLCNCEGKKHQLINNCLTCGRIVCEQEGSGPCYVCGSLVCTVKELMEFNGDTTKASKLYEQLLMKEKPKALDDAIKQRDRLLDFNRNSRKHTHVFDDDSDYFCSSNPWLTLEEREDSKRKEEEFFNKKNESRRNKKMTLKIEGNKIVIENAENNYVHSNLENVESKSCTSTGDNDYDTNSNILSSIDHLIDPYFSKFSLKFQKKLESRAKKNDSIFDSPLSHIMDTEIHQLKDEGYCLSMHQPWASFLVHGIRSVEGRSWYSPYRGKLWIASTGMKTSRQDITNQENTYRFIKGDIKFPADYPPGCLLGCVDLIDCLTQEQYRSQYPDGEIEDPYVFLCDNQQALPVRYPIRGKPNIYKLDERIHKAAANCLYAVDKVLSKSEHKVKSIRP